MHPFRYHWESVFCTAVVAALALLAIGCGRFGYATRKAQNDGGQDAALDGTTVDGDVSDGVVPPPVGQCFVDGDRDGFGSKATVESLDATCTQAGLSSRSTDCNDSDPSIHPGATDIPDDTVDQNCDGTVATTGCDHAKTLADCNLRTNCGWYACASRCLPKNTPIQYVCGCVNAGNQTECTAYGCAWSTCTSRCWPASSPSLQVCNCAMQADATACATAGCTFSACLNRCVARNTPEELLCGCRILGASGACNPSPTCSLACGGSFCAPEGLDTAVACDVP